MSLVKKILVIFDDEVNTNIILSKAVKLVEYIREANDCEPELILLRTVYYDILGKNSVVDEKVRERIKLQCLFKQKMWLDDQVEYFRNKNIKSKNVTKWSPNLLIGLHEAYQEYPDIDLIVKATKHHSVIERNFFTPFDWHLIRKAPVPVLLVKSDKSWDKKRQLVAIDATAYDEDHALLNTKLMTFSMNFSKSFGMETDFVNAYPLPTSLALAPGQLPMLDSLDISIEAQHKLAMDEVIQNFNIHPQNTHLWGGAAEDVIVEAAHKTYTNVVTLGTVSREGINNFLMGNTSEKVIDRVDADILVVGLNSVTGNEH